MLFTGGLELALAVALDIMVDPSEPGMRLLEEDSGSMLDHQSQGVAGPDSRSRVGGNITKNRLPPANRPNVATQLQVT